jgi:hypothetical protein
MVTFPAAPVQPSLQAVANPQVVLAEPAGDALTLIDPRAKAAWLAECRHRAGITGVANNPSEPDRLSSAVDTAHAAQSGGKSYDYCEAYLDDYYRNYSQVSADNRTTYQSQALPQPAQLALTAAAQQPYEEIVTEEYVPVRTRRFAHRLLPRPLRDKRIRLYPR